MDNIKLKGLDNFDKVEKSIVEEISIKGYDKILRDMKNAIMIIHPKKYDIQGNKTRFLIYARVEVAESLISHAEASSWELQKAMHMIINKLENGIQHKFKTKGKRIQTSNIVED